VRLIDVSQHVDGLACAQLGNRTRMEEHGVIGTRTEEVARSADRHAQLAARMHRPQLVGLLFADDAFAAAGPLRRVLVECSGGADRIDVV
jgi:hypothetical protein